MQGEVVFTQQILKSGSESFINGIIQCKQMVLIIIAKQFDPTSYIHVYLVVLLMVLLISVLLLVCKAILLYE